MFEFYKAYGKQEGFPVKKLTSKKGSDETVKYATFAYGRNGKSDSRSTNMLKLKPVVKTGCEARIRGCVNEEGKWILRILNLQHNHGLSLDKARYFLCNRRISANKKIVEILLIKQDDYSIDLDEQDRLKNIFWADPRSKASMVFLAYNEEVLIRHGVEILPEMYILSRWRNDVRRCISKVKVSYGVQNLCIQQERYDKMCIDFTEVANIAADDESSYKFDLQENASTSFKMTNEISTQQNNTAMTFQEGSIVNANLNQYGSLGYYNDLEVGIFNNCYINNVTKTTIAAIDV
ncbi:hypothetical protein WN943_006107 [Citrus x changshan-huyou]